VKQASLRRSVIRGLRPSESIPDGPPRRYRSSHGYIKLRWLVAPNTYVEEYEHRIVAGRPPSDMHVHHINHVKDDNRPENLQVLTPQEHQRLHGELRSPGPRGQGKYHPYRSKHAYDKAQRRLAREARWRAEVEHMRDLYLSGMSTIEVGKAVGIDESNVYRRLAAAGVRMREMGEYAPAIDETAVVAQYEAGRGARAIAREMHVSFQRVKQVLKDAGVKLRKPGRVPKSDSWSERAGKDALEERSDCCEKCGAGGPLEWHHRKNRSQGGTWQPSNGLRLCLPCHRQVTNTRPEYYDAGWCVKEWQTSADVPFEHWQFGKVRISDDSPTYLREAA
jgi:hypothetical protein